MENHAKYQYGQACPICNEAESVGVIELPHSDELERAVLGELIVDTPALCVTMDTLNKALFYNIAHQLIFEAIQNLFNNARAVDMLTVVDELRREGKLEQAGGAEYISQLSTNVVSGAHIQTHIAILEEKYVHREVIRTAAGLLKDASDETCDPYMLLDKGVWSLEKVIDGISHNDSISLGGFMCAVADEINLALEQEFVGIPSGFSSFDTMTHWFQPGTLTVLASKPAMGKTSFALSMARNMACDFCYPVAFFSLQIKGTGLASRLISQEMGIPQSHLKNANKITREKKQVIGEKIKELQETPLYIDDADRINFTQLRCSCKRLIHEHDVRMIFIDGLPQVYVSAENNPNNNREKELYFISRKLKSLSQELNVPILITTCFDHKTEGIPTLSDLQESGCIDEVADNVIGLYRTEQDESSKDTDGKASLQIMKNKDGELGVVDLRYDRNSMKFFDPNTPTTKKNFKAKKLGCSTTNKENYINPDDTTLTDDLPF
jgi:replicative DNA helicase